MAMLIDAGGSRRGRDLDPDEERERRWEPISFRLVLIAFACMTCVSASGVTASPLRFLFAGMAILLCAWFVREALRSSDRGRRRPGRR